MQEARNRLEAVIAKAEDTELIYHVGGPGILLNGLHAESCVHKVVRQMIG